MRRKIRIVRIILTEIVIMALGVVCCIMPMPWRLVVPIIIGTRSILIKARSRLRELPPETMQIENKNEKVKISNAEKQVGKSKVKAADKTAVKKGNKKAV